MATISLKLLVDKEKNRVVFAESDKDFVDILFSFLTLPMGTIIRLLGKQSNVGCMDKLYQSVDNLDTQYLQTKACKTMLLQPRSASEIECEDLKLNVDDLEPRRIYRCPKWDCFTKSQCIFSSVFGARCRCGHAMDKRIHWTRKKVDSVEEGNEDGVFVKGGARFIISDGLHVTPAVSIGAALSLLQKLGIKDAETLEKKIVDISRDKILSLLKRLLLSTTPLTDVFLRKMDSTDVCNGDELQLIDTTQIKSKCNAITESKMIHVKLRYTKVSNKVVYAQAGEDLVDVLFSFLTLPLGSIVKLLDKHSSVGSLDYLYGSVEGLGVSGDYIKLEECKNVLLAPNLYPHFGCSNQILRIEEELSRRARAHGCENCFTDRISCSDKSKCKHEVDVVSLTEINPKLPNSGTEYGGGYAKRSVRFMVTSEMVVTPLSPISGIDVIRNSKAPISSLMEREVTLGESEMLKLLKACLISRMPLSDVFSPKKRRRTI